MEEMVEQHHTATEFWDVAKTRLLMIYYRWPCVRQGTGSRRGYAELKAQAWWLLWRSATSCCAPTEFIIVQAKADGISAGQGGLVSLCSTHFMYSFSPVANRFPQKRRN